MSAIITKLNFTVKKSEQNAQELSITFDDQYFARSVSLFALPNFPKLKIKTIYFECHKNCLSFKSTDQSIAQYANQIVESFSNIQVATCYNKQLKNSILYGDLFKIIDFSCCICYFIVNKPTFLNNQGDFIFYYFPNQKQEVNKLISKVFNFGSFTFEFNLTSKINEFKIETNIIAKYFQQMIECYQLQIEAMAIFYELIISEIKVISKEQTYFISIQCNGVVNETNKSTFTQKFNYFLSTVPMFLIKISNVCRLKPSALPQNFPLSKFNRLLDHDTILCMDREMILHKIQELKCGWHLFVDEFNEKQILVIKRELQSVRFKVAMMKKSLQILQVQTGDSWICIKCKNQNIKSIGQFLKKYVSKFQIESKQVKQIQQGLFSYLFDKFYKQQIPQASFTLSDDQILKRQNLLIDSHEIKKKLIAVSNKLRSQFISIPSLLPFYQYSVKQSNLQNMFVVEEDPKYIWHDNYKTLKYEISQKVELIVNGIWDLVIFQEEVVIIVDGFEQNNSKIIQMLEESGVSYDKFVAQAKNNLGNRVKKYIVQKGTRFGAVNLIYHSVRKTLFDPFNEDIQQSLQQLNSLKLSKAVFLANSQKIIKQLIPILIKKTETNRHSHIKTLQIVCETPKNLSFLQKTINRQLLHHKKTQTKTQNNIVNQWSLLKMNNLKQFIFSYYQNEQTLTLPGIDSYLCNYNLKNGDDGKVVLTLPTKYQLENGFHQFVADLKRNEIYEICSYISVSKMEIKKLNQQFQLLLKMLNKRYRYLRYLTFYAKNEQNIVADDISLNIYCTNEDKLIPLKIDLKNREISEQKNVFLRLPYNLRSRMYVDWKIYRVHKKQAEQLCKCLQK